MASADTVNRAKQFMSIITEMNSTIFDIQDKLNDGEFLSLMNNTKALYDLRKSFETMTRTVIELNEHEIVRAENRRSKLEIKERKRLDEAKALRDGTHCVCEKCDRVVEKTYYYTHKKTELCRKSFETKKLAKETQSLDTKKYTKAIVQIQGLKMKQKVAEREAGEASGSGSV